MLMLMNAARGDNPLVLEQELTRRAESRAQFFCDHALSHDGWQAYFDGTPYGITGENLAKGFKDAQAAVDGLMRSPAHRENILNRGYKRVGIGEACGVIVQLFAD